MLRIVVLCTAKLPRDRPSMRDALTMLGEAKPRRKSGSSAAAAGNGATVAVAAALGLPTPSSSTAPSTRRRRRSLWPLGTALIVGDKHNCRHGALASEKPRRRCEVGARCCRFALRRVAGASNDGAPLLPSALGGATKAWPPCYQRRSPACAARRCRRGTREQRQPCKAREGDPLSDLIRHARSSWPPSVSSLGGARCRVDESNRRQPYTAAYLDARCWRSSSSSQRSARTDGQGVAEI